MITEFNPETDLVLERQLSVPPETLWRCWTEADLLKQWFCPAPWRVSHVVIEPTPGGRFDTTMQGPEGEEMHSPGCVLLADPNRLLAFTDAMTGGLRPAGKGFMTGLIHFTPDGAGCAYRAVVKHATPEDKKSHESMGFELGWGTATDQLHSLAKTL